MLDTIREYASEQLIRRAEAEAEGITDRHAHYFRDLAEGAERRMHSADQRVVLEALEADHDNLRAAFDHQLSTEASGALRMAAALGFFWEIRGHLSEGRERLERALPRAAGSPAAAMATFHAGRLAFLRGDGGDAEPRMTEALRLARDVGDTRAEVLALTHLGVLAQQRGDAARSEVLRRQALVTARAGNDEWTLGMALNDLGAMLAEAGEAERAWPLLEEALEISRRVGEPYSTAMVTGNLAELALRRGDVEAAQPLIAECLHNARDIHDQSMTGWALTLDALVACHRGDLDTAERRISACIHLLRTAYDRAAGPLALATAAVLAAARSEPLVAVQLWGTVDCEMSHHVIDEVWLVTSLRDEWLPQTRHAVSSTEWEAAWETGTGLSPEDAVELAARWTLGRPTTTPHPHTTASAAHITGSGSHNRAHADVARNGAGPATG